jgi:penicillin amidase
MLAANRARSWDDFRAAFDGFAVPGQNMLCADASGRIGRLMAVQVPRRRHRTRDDMVVQPARDDGWDTPVGSRELPCTADPAEGFITSANERPQQCSALIGSLFSAGDRKRRLEMLLRRNAHTSCDDLARLQRDTYWEPASTQRRQLLEWVESVGRRARERQFMDVIVAWDCCYDSGSRGALAFELWCHHLTRRLVPRRRRMIYGASWGTRRLIWDDIESAEPRRRRHAVRAALRNAASALRPDETWGDRHRLRLGHPLALLPVLGPAWCFADLPAGGGADTLMKTAHRQTGGRHAVSYGSMARHVSEMSDPDSNYFVLLGGQDGWIGSTTFLDQVALWQQGKYISLPLRTETARATFQHVTRLAP